MTDSSSAVPFEINVAEEVLDDLRARLRNPRLAPDFPAGWDYGTDAAYLRELLAYWRDEFDWRAVEREINQVPQFRTTIDGVPIHFIHVRGKGSNPTPLILTHGWPWTFWDFRKVIGPLTDPAAHGGDPADSFDVVIPSLPGYGFSTPQRVDGINFVRTADLWVTLMERLGYDRFAAQGGDWGSFVTAQLAHKYADRLIGAHLHMIPPLGITAWPSPDEYAEDERRWISRSDDYFVNGGNAYATLQITQPATISHAMHDSPTALASWIVEKRRAWSDCGGDVETVFSKDDLCTTLTIYWVTESFGTSARYYAEYGRHPWTPVHDRQPPMEAPTAFALFPEDLFAPPRSWTEANYNVASYEPMAEGGHFAPVETPELLVDSIRRFFRGRD